MTAAEKARRLLRRCRFGALATLSKRLNGCPFATVAPYVLDHQARPIVFISGLAEHTKNLAADARASLLVHADAEDVLTAERVTLAGLAEHIEEPPQPLVERYLRYVPSAARLLSFGDFSFWRITPQALHWVGGFGDIQWIPADAYAVAPAAIEAAEASMIAHMNADHAHNMRDYVRHASGREVLDVEMAGVDSDGFDVRADSDLLRFDFEHPVATPGEVRAALVDLARRSRA